MPVALITGGAIRVGRAIALALARSGYEVIVHSHHHSGEAASSLADEIRALGQVAHLESADFTQSQAPAELAQRVIQSHARLDVLVHNAAVYEHSAFETISAAQLERALSVNLKAPFLLTQKLLPALRAAHGCVINITDMAVSHVYTSTHFFSHYLASKAALEQLTRAWALELGPLVRVNAVAPGPVAIAPETTAGQKDDMLKRIPLRREGLADDVAQAVLFLACAPYITGQVLRVDGGLSVA